MAASIRWSRCNWKSPSEYRWPCWGMERSKSPVAYLRWF